MDSYTIDTVLFEAAKSRLAREGRSLGYGIRAESVNTWDGRADAFSQFDRSVMIEDHGRVKDLDAYFHDKRYRNRFLGIRFNGMFKLMGESGVASINAHIEGIRRRPSA